MKLKEQVCSDNQAKELKELGIEQESLYYHVAGYDNICTSAELKFSSNSTMITAEKYSAFTVAELGVLLPDQCETFRAAGKWHCDSIDVDFPSTNEDINTEAFQRADMLIYLIKYRNLSVEYCNQRLIAEGNKLQEQPQSYSNQPQMGNVPEQVPEPYVDPRKRGLSFIGGNDTIIRLAEFHVLANKPREYEDYGRKSIQKKLDDGNLLVNSYQMMEDADWKEAQIFLRYYGLQYQIELIAGK